MISVSKKFTLGFVCITLFISCSTELPVDSKENSTVEVSDLMDDFHDFHAISDDASVPRNSSIERWNHSRMLLKSTTLGYDEWWFLTTQRTPPLSYKDFPGRPGVATWKEINPGESRDSRKLKPSPTAEAASSAWQLHSSSSWLYVVLCIVFLQFFRNP